MMDSYLIELGDRLHVSRRQRARILLDARDHLEDSVTHHVASGLAAELATRRAVAAFGSAESLAVQLNAQAATTTMRRLPIGVFAAGILTASGFLIAVATQSQMTTPRPANALVEVGFFLAVIAFEIACVAGGRAAAHALAVSGASVVGVDDRVFVRRCSRIGAAALLGAAADWAAIVVVGFRHREHVALLPLVAGVTVMLTAALGATVAISRARVNELADTQDHRPSASGPRAIGERAVALVHRHPVAICALAAVGTGLGAMSHAETSVVGSLPWGVGQAAAVVLGFVLIGPALRLRPTSS